jgi:predicted RNA binding protein YcfA (HicA-like mRNA interferase family)
MPRFPGVNHQAVRAFEKADFIVVRQSGHVVLRKDEIILIIPRGNPIKPYTMGDLIRASGLTVDEFKALLN